jgi:2-polyprenyl-3-methyl-5-hydroxy-6-metoxy-1,4-benzoquinol methylase
VLTSPTARSHPLLKALKHKIWDAVHEPDPPAESGVHIDPLDVPPVDMSTRSTWHREAFAGPEMAAFRRGLTIGDADVRTSILDDLATYFDITPDEARRRALHWEEISVQEWADANGDDGDDGRVEFYRTQNSWAYDLMWWAYLQSEGHADPSNVVALRFLQQWAPGRRHLDFGSGVGVTTQVFLETGWTSTMADLSSTLLDFARFRLERRGQEATTIDLLDQDLPAGAYDAITAIDTLAHVPDVHQTARALHTALGRDGVLVANIDVRSAAPETVWHLQDDEKRAGYDVLRAGFVHIGSMGYELQAYRKVRPGGLRFRVRTLAQWVVMASPLRRVAVRASRRVLRSLWSVRERLR